MKHGTRRGNVVYHWKHGWIPLDHFAALSKAHHSKAGAVKVMQKHGIDVPKAYNSDHKPSGGHSSPSNEHFRMTGKELQDRAGKGDLAAAAELARRAARKDAAGGKFGGKRPGVPFRPPTKPTEPKAAVPRAAAPKPVAPKAPEAPKPPPPPMLSPEGAYLRDRGSMTPAERVTKARKLFGPGHSEHENALNAENGHIEEALTRWPSAGPGHKISSFAGSYATTHHHLLADSKDWTGKREIGKVVETHDKPGSFVATHIATKRLKTRTHREATDLGTFTSREDAHKAIVSADARHQNAEIDKKLAKQAAADRKASKVAGIPGPNGTTWEIAPHNPMVKASQVFKAGNKTVTVESTMSAEKTRALLDDITTAVDSVPSLHAHDVSFVVPTGDGSFRSGKRGTTGAYVHAGGKTVYINPQLANGKHTAAFQDTGESGWHMPAAATTPGNAYTYTHELGHVHDNIHGHTREVVAAASGRLSWPMVRTDAAQHHRDQVDALSKYGNKNPAEGYAEAFAQYHVAGPGSHPAADAYAAHYGWAAPGKTGVRPSTIIAAQSAAASLSPAEVQKLTGGKDLAQLSSQQLQTIIRAARRTRG